MKHSKYTQALNLFFSLSNVFSIYSFRAIEVKVVQKTGQVVWKSKKQVATTFLMTHWLHDSMGQKLVEVCLLMNYFVCYRKTS
ncbi:hypothetical protein CIPAW_07G131500 [Carya illinoinensis]|uniref:Uncharacterized protein n=1 Tax=Carya illinoinensis TaxID=32201 RepID=A0A8T1Q4M8_CARIL|nr:hypothetical protein CIPAW_07G131500 [Carya illinoinensis]